MLLTLRRETDIIPTRWTIEETKGTLGQGNYAGNIPTWTDLDLPAGKRPQSAPKAGPSRLSLTLPGFTGNTFGQLFAYMHCIDVAHKKRSTPNNIQGICHVHEKKGTAMENPALRGSKQKSYEHSALSCWPWSHELTNDRLVAGPAHKETIANTHTPKTR